MPVDYRRRNRIRISRDSPPVRSLEDYAPQDMPGRHQVNGQVVRVYGELWKSIRKSAAGTNPTKAVQAAVAFAEAHNNKLYRRLGMTLTKAGRIPKPAPGHRK